MGQRVPKLSPALIPRRSGPAGTTPVFVRGGGAYVAPLLLRQYPSSCDSAPPPPTAALLLPVKGAPVPHPASNPRPHNLPPARAGAQRTHLLPIHHMGHDEGAPQYCGHVQRVLNGLKLIAEASGCESASHGRSSFVSRAAAGGGCHKGCRGVPVGTSGSTSVCAFGGGGNPPFVVRWIGCPPRWVGGEGGGLRKTAIGAQPVELPHIRGGDCLLPPNGEGVFHKATQPVPHVVRPACRSRVVWGSAGVGEGGRGRVQVFGACPPVAPWRPPATT